jgi:4-hydroxybenzoate polyprenyltransferase
MTKILRAWLYESRPFIALHYIFPTAFGIFLAGNYFNAPIYTVRSFILVLSIFFSYQTSIILNDINDIQSDALLKRKTPLNQGDLTLKQYQNLGLVLLGVSILLALSLGYKVLLIVLLGHILHFLYSSPPFRLKRFYPLSIMMLAGGALLAAIAGFSLIEPAKPFLSFPPRSALFIFIPLLLALNFRDLADYEGDKKTDVQTLFTLAGIKRGKIINAVLMFLSYFSVPVILRCPLLFIATVPLGALTSRVCLKTPFREKNIFYLYFILIVTLTILFNLKPEMILQ